MLNATETTKTPPKPASIELTDQDLDKVVGGVGLGLRKSAGGTVSGSFFLSFVFKLVA